MIYEQMDNDDALPMYCNDTSTAPTSLELDDVASSKRKHKKRKASKGRLKKLWRRAKDTTLGITSRSEWLELIELQLAFEQSVSSGNSDNDACSGEYEDVKQGGEPVATIDTSMLGPLPGPNVCLVTQPHRDFSQLENWQMTEGSDHRDLLINLLFGGEGKDSTDDNRKQKKRKTHTTSGQIGANSSLPIHVPTLPSWSNISNLASVGGVAVVEIEIIGGEDNDDTVCPLFPSRRIIDSVNDKCENVWTTLVRPTNSNIEGDSDKVTRTISTACKVKLFQDDNSPRCLSDVLMYLPPSNSSEAKIIEGHDIFHSMHNLTLTLKQMRAERFPIAASSADLSRTAVPLRSDNTMTVELARGKILEMSRTLQSEGVIIKNDHLNDELIRTLSTDVIIDVDEIAMEKGDELSKTEHYVKTFRHRVSGNDVQRKIFAIDCEMVKTSSEYPELARVSVLMFIGGENVDDERTETTVVLDELVKPCRKVLDYITEYSGISAVMLEDIDTRIEDIQVRLLAMIDEDDIIVGHSLENDLRALRLIHDKVIDSSVIFRGANGRKFSLKHLSNVLLNRKIQCGSRGPSSYEDAEAALVLALRRARHGESFRLKANAIRQNIIGVFQKINHTVKQQRQDATSFVERNDGACVCIGDNDWITKYAQSAEGSQHVLSCNSILNTMVMAIPSWLSSSSATKRAGLLWANLRCEDRSTNGNGQWKNEVQKLDELVVS